MAKKRRIPQTRKRQKKTTGQLKFTNVVYLEKETVDDKERVYATCTCGEWRSSPAAVTIGKAGMEAKQHIIDSQGKCAFRQHPETPDLEEIDDEFQEVRAQAEDPLKVLQDVEIAGADDAGTS